MIWDIDLDIAAIILEMVLLFFDSGKIYCKTLKNMFFSALLYASMALTILDITTSFTFTYYDMCPVELNWILGVMYDIIMCIVPFYIFAYISFVAKKRFSRTKWLLWVAPCIIVILMVISTPWTGLIFSMTENGYVHGKLWSVLFAESVFYITSMLFLMFVCGKEMRKGMKFCILIFTIFVLAVDIVQKFIIPDRLLLMFILAIVLFMLFIMVKKPDRYIDNEYNLLNKDALFEVLDEKMRGKREFMICVYSIDNYMSICREYGKEVGKAVFRQLADDSIKKYDKKSIFILGPSQVAIVWKQKGEFDLEKKHIQPKSAHYVRYEDKSISVVFTAVLAYCPCPVNNAVEMTELMEFSLHKMKKAGQCVTDIVNREMYNEFKRYSSIESRLRDAMDNDRVQVFYQPVYSIKERRVTEAEALARIYDPEIGYIPPAEFIRIAESNGEIIRLGEIIFEKVCRFFKEYSPQKYGIEHISVNLSAIQCLKENLCEEMLQTMYRYDVSPSQITLEVTETEEITERGYLACMMEKMRKYGIRFSLDDYGTGYSSLSYVIQANFDIIKIDRSILVEYFYRDKNALKYLVEMFRKMGYTIVVEGVENSAQARKLEEMYVDYIQGYYYSTPLDEERFIEYLARQKWTKNVSNSDEMG